MNLNDYEIEEVHIDEIRPGDIIINSKGQSQTVSGTDIKGGASRYTTLFGDSYRLGRILVKRIVQNPNGTLKVKQIKEAIKLIESISGNKVVLVSNIKV